MRALVNLLDWLIWIELIAMFARGILSFVVSEYRNANMQLLVQCTEPVVPWRLRCCAILRRSGDFPLTAGFSCWWGKGTMAAMR